MSENTLTHGGVELNIEDLETAIEEIDRTEDGYIVDSHVVVGSVALAGDGYHDTDVIVSDVQDVSYIGDGGMSSENSTLTAIENLEEEIEESQSSDFAEYVHGLDISDMNTVEQWDEAKYPYLGEVDAAVIYGYLNGSEMQSLIEADGVAIGKVKARDGTAYIGLHDTR